MIFLFNFKRTFCAVCRCSIKRTLGLNGLTLCMLGNFASFFVCLLILFPFGQKLTKNEVSDRMLIRMVSCDYIQFKRLKGLRPI